MTTPTLDQRGHTRGPTWEQFFTPTRTREAYLGGIVVIAGLLFALAYGSFLSPSNLSQIIVDSSILIIVSSVQFMIVLTKQIDLSVGSVMGMTCMIVGVTAANSPGLPVGLFVLEGAALGLGLGLVNASIIAGLQVPSMIVTLTRPSKFTGASLPLTHPFSLTSCPIRSSILLEGRLSGSPDGVLRPFGAGARRVLHLADT